MGDELVVGGVVISSLINGRTGFPSSNSLVRNLAINSSRLISVMK